MIIFVKKTTAGKVLGRSPILSFLEKKEAFLNL
jgi:hypothetical protein